MIFVSGQEGREKKKQKTKQKTRLPLNSPVRRLLCAKGASSCTLRALPRALDRLPPYRRASSVFSLSLSLSLRAPAVSEAREFRKKRRRTENLKLISTFSRRYFGDRGLFSRFRNGDKHTTDEPFPLCLAIPFLFPILFGRTVWSFLFLSFL